MRRIARFLMICLLLMAIPVKGAVAASIVMCGPGQERTSAAVAMEPAAIADGDMIHHEHDHASNHQANDAGDHDQGSLTGHGAVKCSICAACCVGGALLASTEVSVPASGGTEAHFPALDVHFPWTVLAGLERPPRTFFL